MFNVAVIKKMQIKPRVWHSTPIRMAMLQKCDSMFLCRAELSLAATGMQIAQPLYCTGRQHGNFL